MICPFCNHNNIDGVDECAECRGSLAGFDGDDNTSRIERDLLKRKLGEIVAHDYVEIPPDLPIRDAIRRLNEGDCHCAIVVDENGIAGIFTERDVLTKLADQYGTHADAPVSTCMTPDPVSTGDVKPRWTIPAEAIDEYERANSNVPAAAQGLDYGGESKG